MNEIVPNNKLLDLSGKTVIVTGGAMGIGLGIVFRLAQSGANVMIADINQEEAEKVANKLSSTGMKIKAVKTDMASEEDIKKLIEETVTSFGSLDILVNNAGIYPLIPVTQMNAEQFEKIISINLKGVFLSCKYAAEQMIKQGHGGKIINITSIDALHPSMVGLAAYDASKHGLWGFTKNLALELSQHNIWVNAVAPGGIATPGVQKMSGGSSQAETSAKETIDSMSSLPMHRIGEPDDIGKAVLFLASEMNTYMTGSQIVVDGGFLLQ